MNDPIRLQMCHNHAEHAEMFREWQRLVAKIKAIDAEREEIEEAAMRAAELHRADEYNDAETRKEELSAAMDKLSDELELMRESRN